MSAGARLECAAVVLRPGVLPLDGWMMTPTSLAAYLLLFVCAACGFLAVHLLIGRLLRPNLPNTEKLQAYECGEPAIGSAFVQFDLRFYVIALLFIIFDVEVAFFFAWATVFGKTTHLMDPRLAVVTASTADGQPAPQRLSEPVQTRFAEMGVPKAAWPHPDPQQTVAENSERVVSTARQIAWLSLADILAFFAVLMVGFAYVWSRGDLDWVRAVSQERAELGARNRAVRATETEPALSA